MATCSADSLVNIWNIPSEIKKDIEKPILSLSGHGKKVTLLSFNQTAEGILATTGIDRLIKIWDVCAGKENYSIEGA